MENIIELGLDGNELEMIGIINTTINFGNWLLKNCERDFDGFAQFWSYKGELISTGQAFEIFMETKN